MSDYYKNELKKVVESSLANVNVKSIAIKVIDVNGDTHMNTFKYTI